MRLYYARGACSLAPHIVLEELAIPFTAVAVSLADDEQTAPDYLQINPRGRVPALEVHGSIYTEVPALLVYLASLKPEAGLTPPPGSTALARCLEWVAWLSSTFHAAIAQLFRPHRYLSADADTGPLQENGMHNIRAMAAEVEVSVGDGWLLGEAYTIADAYLFPFYRWGNIVGLSMSKDYPAWSAWITRMARRPAVMRTLEREGIKL